MSVGPPLWGVIHWIVTFFPAAILIGAGLLEVRASQGAARSQIKSLF
jgi:hypothetical protein